MCVIFQIFMVIDFGPITVGVTSSALFYIICRKDRTNGVYFNLPYMDEGVAITSLCKNTKQEGG
jgi:hypothetical protein